MAAAITLERILALQAAYIRCIDSNDLEAWPDFFADRCLYVVTSAENHKAGFEGGIIYADTKGMLIDRIAALREANVYEKQSYRHILGLPNVMKNGGDTAESETPFMVVRVMHDGQTDIFATGVYLDTLRATGNDLKFSKRVVVCDSSRVDTLMALPL
jgi:anthranilate 1,2-dioxygenase small subunit